MFRSFVLNTLEENTEFLSNFTSSAHQSHVLTGSYPDLIFMLSNCKFDKKYFFSLAFFKIQTLQYYIFSIRSGALEVSEIY